jgi:hypothetical protein
VFEPVFDHTPIGFTPSDPTTLHCGATPLCPDHPPMIDAGRSESRLIMAVIESDPQRLQGRIGILVDFVNRYRRRHPAARQREQVRSAEKIAVGEEPDVDRDFRSRVCEHQSLARTSREPMSSP